MKWKRFKALLERGAFALRKGWRNRKMRQMPEVMQDYNRKLAQFGHAERQLQDLRERIATLEKDKAGHLGDLKKLEAESTKIQQEQRRLAKARGGQLQLAPVPEAPGEAQQGA